MTDLIALPHTNNEVIVHTPTPELRSSDCGRIMEASHPNRLRLNVSTCDVSQDPTCVASHPSNDFRYKPTEQTLTPTFLLIMNRIRLQLEAKVRNAGYLGPLDFELKDFHVFLGEVSTSLLCAVDIWYRTVYQNTLYWEKLWREAYDDETPLTKEQEFVFFDQMRTGAEGHRARWRDLFLHRNEGLVGKLIKPYTGRLHTFVYWKRLQRGLPTEQELLFRAGYKGLKKAVDTFKPELGYKFSTHAWKWIKGEITAFFKGSKAELLEHISMGDDEVVTLKFYPNEYGLRLPEDHLELICAVGQALERLNDSRSTQIIIMRYGLFGGKKHTFKEIGAACGITLQRVHKLLPTILEQLRNDRELRGFWNRWKNPRRWADECDLRALGITVK